MNKFYYTFEHILISLTIIQINAEMNYCRKTIKCFPVKMLFVYTFLHYCKWKPEPWEPSSCGSGSIKMMRLLAAFQHTLKKQLMTIVHFKNLGIFCIVYIQGECRSRCLYGAASIFAQGPEPHKIDTAQQQVQCLLEFLIRQCCGAGAGGAATFCWSQSPSFRPGSGSGYVNSYKCYKKP
jgi:hypothetical protein